MVSNADRREELRPQGLVSPSCADCQFRTDCGGYHSGQLFGNCFELTCCHFTGKDKNLCNAVCPYKSDFDEWVAEVKGLRFDDLPVITQPILELPAYVPVVDHASSRSKALEWPVVALNTYSVIGVRRTDHQYRALADTPEGLRNAFRLGHGTRILLRGTARDAPLERYWEFREAANAPGQLARLDVCGAIGPNFSHFLDQPRTDHIFNKRRQLMCLLEFINAGITTIPHLNSVMPGDWWLWRRFLKRNATISVIAIEFQTGHKNPKQGRKTIEQLSLAQRDIGRPLHLVLIGGAQFIEYAATRFSQITLVDSTPFHKTMHRCRFDHAAGKQPWSAGFKLIGQKLDSDLLENITSYGNWIAERIRIARLPQVGSLN